MADRVGQQFGNYRLLRLLGRGGFAEVYEATHPQRGRVALKILNGQLDERGLQDFLNDVRAVLLRHPHIIEIVDFGVEGQTAYLAMPYFVDGSLQTHHQRGNRLPLSTIVDYVRQIAEALQYAHDHGTIHRDVKPGNVLVGPQGTLVLADFGISVMFDQRQTHRTVEFAGSLEYAAPEQFLEKPGPASDQYALATMVYEWLTGEVPFPLTENPTPLKMGRKKTQEPAPRLVGIPPVVEQVVLTALATDPRNRFGSVIAFANALSQASEVDQTTLMSSQNAAINHAITLDSLPPISTLPLVPVVSPDIAALSPLPSLQTPAPTKQKSATKSNHTARKILVGLLILVVLVGGSMLGLNLARKDITGTWSGPSFYNGTANGEIDTYTLTQSGASITGTGYVTDMSSQVSLSVTGSINFYFVTLHAFADGCNNLTLTLTLSLDSNTMSGSALSLCNSTGTFTITLTRK